MKHSPLTYTIANQSSQHKISYYLPHASIVKILRISTRASNNEFWSKENSCRLKHVIINNTCLKGKTNLELTTKSNQPIVLSKTDKRIASPVDSSSR